MTILLIFFSALVALAGLSTVVFPSTWLMLAKRVRITLPLRLLAFAVRVLLGVMLISVADSTGYPLPLKLIGVVLIVAGVLALLLGNEQIQAIIDWTVDRGPGVVRAGGAIALLFGVLVVYALT